MRPPFGTDSVIRPNHKGRNYLGCALTSLRFCAPKMDSERVARDPPRYRDSSKHLLESSEPGSIKVLLRRKTMVRTVKLRRMGGSVGATLPKEMAERLHLEAGDEVLAVETANGILLSPYDPDVEEGLAIAAEAPG